MSYFKVSCKKQCHDCETIIYCDMKDSIAEGILFDCYSFYTIYRALEDHNHIPFEDENAMGTYFEKKKQSDIPHLLIPEMVNGAFAIELAIKYLSFRETGQFIKTHSLIELYNNLPDPHKKVLSEKIFCEANQNEKTFQKKLKRN